MVNSTHTNANKAVVDLPAKPEDQELALKRAELSSIESELAEAELHLTSLRAELSAFESEYLRSVGARYAELDELKAQLAEKLAATASANRASKLSAERARARSNESKTATESGDEHRKPIVPPSPHTKRLYREVAKRIHPDLTTDLNDRAKREELMAEANRAYESGDEALLARILADYEYRPEAVTGDDAGAELIRAIRKISKAKVRMAEIESAITELTRSDLYQMRQRLDEAARLGQDVLKEITERVNAQIAQVRQRLQTANARSNA